MTTSHPAFISNLYYTVAQVAKKTGLSRSFIYAEISIGNIPAVRPFKWGRRRPLRIERKWLDEHLDSINREAKEAVATDPEIDIEQNRRRAA
ncbi:MAG: excisionase family DNA-binding protein [bacterium]